MKKSITIFIVFFVTLSANAQLVNWKSNNDYKNFAYFNMGYDFGLVNQIGFAYRLNSERNIYLNSDFSAPMGKDIFDDFKYRLGGQMLLVAKNKFLVSSKIDFVYRKTETALVNISNLGLDAGVAAGLYSEKWHVALELNYDHAMLANLRHSELMRDDFASITDGWYSNAAGNFSYGIQASKSLGKALDLNFRIGAVASKFNDVNPLIPRYVQLGLSYSFK